MENKKIYRPNVAAVILSSKYPDKCEFFVAHRSDIQNAWQFPQGGIDEGETPREALKREGFPMIFLRFLVVRLILLMGKDKSIFWCV